jgi:hypothetical protein
MSSRDAGWEEGALARAVAGPCYSLLTAGVTNYQQKPRKFVSAGKADAIAQIL